MNALQNVLDTIMEVFAMIRKFFEDLLGLIKGEESTTAAAE